MLVSGKEILLLTINLYNLKKGGKNIWKKLNKEETSETYRNINFKSKSALIFRHIIFMVSHYSLYNFDEIIILLKKEQSLIFMNESLIP